jgi:hypothetical protein
MIVGLGILLCGLLVLAYFAVITQAKVAATNGQTRLSFIRIWFLAFGALVTVCVYFACFIMFVGGIGIFLYRLMFRS